MLILFSLLQLFCCDMSNWCICIVCRYLLAEWGHTNCQSQTNYDQNATIWPFVQLCSFRPDSLCSFRSEILNSIHLEVRSTGFNHQTYFPPRGSDQYAWTICMCCIFEDQKKKMKKKQKTNQKYLQKLCVCST